MKSIKKFLLTSLFLTSTFLAQAGDVRISARDTLKVKNTREQDDTDLTESILELISDAYLYLEGVGNSILDDLNGLIR